MVFYRDREEEEEEEEGGRRERRKEEEEEKGLPPKKVKCEYVQETVYVKENVRDMPQQHLKTRRHGHRFTPAVHGTMLHCDGRAAMPCLVRCSNSRIAALLPGKCSAFAKLLCIWGGNAIPY